MVSSGVGSSGLVAMALDSVGGECVVKFGYERWYGGFRFG